MNWIKIEEVNSYYRLKVGTICRTEEGDIIIVGHVNQSLGTNDEFFESITHYTEDFIDDIDNLIRKCKKDLENYLNKL